MRDRWRTLSWLVRLASRRRRAAARASLRPGGPAGRATVVMMAMALPLSLSLGAGVGGGSASLRWPSAGSLVWSVAHLVDVVTDQHQAAPKIPAQRTGSAPSRSRQVPAAVTRRSSARKGCGRGRDGGSSRRSACTLRAAHVRHRAGFARHRLQLQPAHQQAGRIGHDRDVGPVQERGRQLHQARVRGAGELPDFLRGVGRHRPDLASSAGGRWDEKANSASVSFAGRAAAKQLGSLAAAGGAQSVSFSLAGAADVPGTTDGATITYPGVMPGTDLTETAAANGGISETLVLHSADVATTWDFPLQTDGLTPVLSQGSVDLENAAGKTVWVIPPAVASSGPAGLTDGPRRPPPCWRTSWSPTPGAPSSR